MSDIPYRNPDEQLPIPIEAAEHIAKYYGYDQIVIVGRKVGGFEHVTTYGKDKANCGVAARMGDFFKHKLMGWSSEPVREFNSGDLANAMMRDRAGS